MLVKYVTLFFIFCLQYYSITSSDSCGTNKTCRECIRDPSVCVWCAENDFNGTRCTSLYSYPVNWCPGNLQNPKDFRNATETRDFSSVSNQVIQIKPQRFKFKLRPGKSQNFDFSFQGAKNYAVDIYFLLDASKTMNSVKEATATHSENIYLAIQNMTNNVYMGLGTFVDKRVLPFSNKSDSEKIYSFRHRVSLVDDFKLFKEQVIKTPIGINRDSPEGGLDALAQAMVCDRVIGWRNESRKIIVFITDSLYHSAGDGKSAGLFQPYDGKCYTENNTYTNERVMDYPSVGMIRKLAADTQITIIFFVKDIVEPYYNRLSNVISGSKVTTYKENKTNSDAIVTTLKDIYVKISKRIKLKPIVRIGHKKKFQFSFKPNCTVDSHNDECEVEIGKEQPLVGTVKLLEYYGSKNATIDIIVEGIGEKITFDIDIIDSCECDDSVEPNSTFCSGEKRACGSCICSDNRLSERCTVINSNSTCIAAGSDVICSKRGNCVNGICQCLAGYTDDYCECKLGSCPRNLKNDQICNGFEVCRCGKCDCPEDWSGDACDCSKSVIDCQGPNGQICNNRGKCVCGACECESFALWDARISHDPLCKVQSSPDRHEMQCAKLGKCVECKRMKETDCSDCEGITTEVLETLPERYSNNSDWNVCNLKVVVGCYTSFAYQYIDPPYSLHLIVSTDQNCAENYYMFGGFFFLTLLLIGAGTLIGWKLLTDARDRQEYLRFQQNKDDGAGPCDNILYQNPSTRFMNPAFRKKSVDVN